MKDEAASGLPTDMAEISYKTIRTMAQIHYHQESNGYSPFGHSKKVQIHTLPQSDGPKSV
jgi:hypothetical protein